VAGPAFYNRWNFSDNPFSARALKADAIGDQLFVGRDDELKRVSFRLAAGDSAVCLDGAVGVGKTSLANIAAYRAERAHVLDRTSPLLLPCRESFQVSQSESPDEFRLRVLREVAQTLLDKASAYRMGLNMEGRENIDSWLNSPLHSQWSVGIPVFNVGAGNQANESDGYVRSGFMKTVTTWLESIFPDETNGGVVCVLDNLELLETSADARRKIEALRDTLFTIKGLRWILCGAHGILQGIVASQRLVGHLQEPVFVPPLALSQAHDVFNARVRTFAVQNEKPTYLPFGDDDFHSLYVIVHRNLRNALAYAGEYCMSVAESGSEPQSRDDKKARFEAWLKNRAVVIRDAVVGQVGPRALQLFREVIKQFDGEFAPSDCNSLGFKNVQALRPHVKSLEEAGLLQAQKDDTDQRRKSISVTGKGWLVSWCEVTGVA
jgi:hypothetical protein